MFSPIVNLVNYKIFPTKAAMTGTPQHTWTADKAIDGNTSKDYQSNSCAISEVNVDMLTKRHLFFLKDNLLVSFETVSFSKCENGFYNLSCT